MQNFCGAVTDFENIVVLCRLGSAASGFALGC